MKLGFPDRHGNPSLPAGEGNLPLYLGFLPIVGPPASTTVLSLHLLVIALGQVKLLDGASISSSVK